MVVNVLTSEGTRQKALPSKYFLYDTMYVSFSE